MWASAASTSGVSWTTANCGSISPGRARRTGRTVPDWPASSTLTPNVHPLVQHRAELRAPIERDEHERRGERDRHERVRGHAVHLLARARGEDGHPGREHSERPAERDRGIAVELPDVDRLRIRNRVERGSIRQPGPGRQRNIELLRKRHRRRLSHVGLPGPARRRTAATGSRSSPAAGGIITP